VSADGSGTPNPYDPADAIFSAAHYLQANGALADLRGAIYAYNHADRYVDEVMWKAMQIDQDAVSSVAAQPAADASVAAQSQVTGADIGAGAQSSPAGAQATTIDAQSPTASPQTKLTAMLTTANLLDGLPYVFGGGHANWTVGTGYDCSGFVAAVLHAAGYLTAPADTQTLPSQPGILSGPGQWVTIYDRTDGGALDEDHVIINIDGQWWESGGTTNAGVHQMPTVSSDYLATFNLILHPAGL
jgi:cell wall-associated NlpC family hydrolase